MEITPSSSRGSGHMALVNGMSSSDGSVSPTVGRIIVRPAVAYAVGQGAYQVANQALQLTSNVVNTVGTAVLDGMDLVAQIEYRPSPYSQPMGPFGRTLEQYRKRMISNRLESRNSKKRRVGGSARVGLPKNGHPRTFLKMMWIKHP